MSVMLLLDLKEEPSSPLGYEEATWLTEDSFYQTALQFETELEANNEYNESKAEVASQILENLENLVDIDELIKDEPFLLDEKMLPILDEVEPPRATPVPVHSVKLEYIKSHNDTQFLLKEFENVLDVVEFKYGTLTPPQSPPSESPMLTTLEPLLTQPTYTTLPEKQATYSVPEKQLTPNVLDYINQHRQEQNISQTDYMPVVTSQPDIAHELAVVEELLLTRVQDMQWISEPSSPSSNSSSSSNFGDCSSDDHDPEWIPETVETDSNNSTLQLKSPRKRSKPYSRTSEDKKVRKKEQNKNAATRYRMKKKAEVEEILGEERALMDENVDLGNKISDVQREIKYLKGLMRDLFKAKGLIN